MKTEHILAAEACLFADYKPDGAQVVPGGSIDNASLFLLQRARAETDEAYRHIIPYTVLMNKKNEVLVYQRGKGAGEQRLAGLCSIGFGGHIDLNDIRYEDSTIDLERTLDVSSRRELLEELSFFTTQDVNIERLGYILDNSNAVGRVHVGILQMALYMGKYSSIASRESELTLKHWKAPADIDTSTLEPWSKAVVEFLVGVDEIYESQESLQDSLDTLQNALTQIMEKKEAAPPVPMVFPPEKSIWQKLAFWQ